MLRHQVMSVMEGHSRHTSMACSILCNTQLQDKKLFGECYKSCMHLIMQLPQMKYYKLYNYNYELLCGCRDTLFPRRLVHKLLKEAEEAVSRLGICMFDICRHT